ncbi:hypothetical protein GJ629_10260 [Halapricum sp. CBA1109]|uniref:hypothetical protein n=1 Tax=Halapricum sp. CBA1109 TaxID=2668068 RepID=UPI0012F802F2|nr:hypothetical protein [Halapricum sp. CBA1109]MUV90225.1 hypothetical protein [Halapricum sp. CBA1109]
MATTETFGTVAHTLPDVTVHYSERQRFRQGWLWALLLVSSLPAALIGVVAVAVDSDPGTNVPLWVAFVLLVVFAPLVVFYRATFRVEVRDDGLAFRLWPLHLSYRTVTCSDIETVTPTEISPFGDFGGVGVRLSPTLYRWGVRFDGPLGYIVSGESAVRIRRSQAQDIVLTSEDPYALSAALDRVCPKD